MADMKDFVGEVVKKLPVPKRLEVVGTIRKTLILHFECVHTGYEFPVISKEWSKWLKMGFSLAKAGKAVIDIGMGNPLALITTGVDCVKGIYDAYKTEDDDEFNTYITNPFLLSTEQDQLIEKLRDQGFFDKLAYDAQIPGWYLLNPEEDGQPPEGDAGSVSKVRTKDGYGVGEAVTSALLAGADEMGLGGDVITDTLLETAADVAGQVADKVQVEMTKKMNKDGKTDSANTTSSSPVGAAPTKAAGAGGPKAGSRAQQMRTQMGESGTLDEQSATSKLQQADGMTQLKRQVADLEGTVEKMGKDMQQLKAEVARVDAKPAGGCCTIC
jgi:hypothetical protein